MSDPLSIGHLDHRVIAEQQSASDFDGDIYKAAGRSPGISFDTTIDPQADTTDDVWESGDTRAANMVSIRVENDNGGRIIRVHHGVLKPVRLVQGASGWVECYIKGDHGHVIMDDTHKAPLVVRFTGHVIPVFGDSNIEGIR